MRIRAIDESGQTLVLGAIFLTVLMGFLALALDVGVLFKERQQMQVAADAAAAAAALDYKYSQTNSVQSDANTAATQNEMIATGTVTINNPPKSGPYSGTAGYTEAIVSEPYPTFFMRVFGIRNVNVAGRSVVGGTAGAGNGCMWTLAKSGIDISIAGNGSLAAVNCDIYDDSSANNAMTLNGNATISAKAIGIVGNYTPSHNSSINPTPVTGIAPAANPLTVAIPTPTGSCSGNACVVSVSSNTSKTIQPGTYTSISVSGNGTLTLAPGNYVITGGFSNAGNGNIIFGGGTYTIGGNLDLEGNGSLSQQSGSSGVSFFTNGSTTVAGNGSINLTAPTSGTYSGLLFAEPTTDSGAVQISGNGSAKMNGIVYAPSAALTLGGNGSMTVDFDLITDSTTIAGNANVTINNYASVDNTNSVLGSSKLVMVE